VLDFLAPARRAALAVLFFALVVAAAAAAEPLLMKYVFDHLAVPTAAAVGVGLILLLGLVREALAALQGRLAARTRARVQYTLTEAIVGRLQQLPMAFHRDAGVGATMTQLDRGVQGFVGAASEVVFNVAPAATYLVIALALMLQLSPRLAVLALVFAPLPGIIARTATPEQIERERDLLDRWTRIYGRFNEVLSGIVIVKSFAMEDREKQRFLSRVRDANDVFFKGTDRDALVSASQNISVVLARVAVLGYGAWLVGHGRISLGTLVAFMGYVGSMFAPIGTLAAAYKTARVATASIDQVLSILDRQDTLGDAPDALELPRLRGELEFSNVRFTYGRRASDRALIDGVTLKIRPGEFIAIVGPSGAGKKTLMSLLCRFYDPSEGAVRIDGQDLRSIKQRSFRRQIGIVFQDALLFNETVRSNLAYGRPEASQAEIEDAARTAQAHAFIRRLPAGYDTVVGEGGNRLSAGERQRLAIARALLMDPPVLVLEEPTASLDAESEAMVDEALRHLTHGRTTLTIARRLTTAASADRVVVLRDGRVVEQGPHLELMSRQGYYWSLVERRTRGLLPEDRTIRRSDDRRRPAMEFLHTPSLPDRP
jgi:ATP-binding cassette subfamily B protein